MKENDRTLLEDLGLIVDKNCKVKGINLHHPKIAAYNKCADEMMQIGNLEKTLEFYSKAHNYKKIIEIIDPLFYKIKKAVIKKDYFKEDCNNYMSIFAFDENASHSYIGLLEDCLHSCIHAEGISRLVEDKDYTKKAEELYKIFSGLLQSVRGFLQFISPNWGRD